MTVRREESQDLCSLVGAEDKECYANATEAMYELPEGQFPGITYVEGWAKIHEIPILANHAWLELADGSVIDPTPAYCHTLGCTLYYGAVRYSLNEVNEELRKSGGMLPLHDGFRTDFIHPDHFGVYRKAYKDTYGEESEMDEEGVRNAWEIYTRVRSEGMEEINSA